METSPAMRQWIVKAVLFAGIWWLLMWWLVQVANSILALLHVTK